MDDFFERLLKSLAIVLAGLVLIYVLIATSSERPTGLSLYIYGSMNQFFSWLVRLIAIAVTGFILISACIFWTNAKADLRRSSI